MRLSLDFIKIKPGKKNAQQIRALNFLIRLNIFAIPLYAILIFDTSFAPLQRLVADITFSLLSAAGFNPVMNDLLISIPIKDGSWGALINWDCTGWKSLLAFAALVLATDKSKGKKIHGLALFLPLIFIANIARIFFMFFFVRTYDLALFPLVHAVVWSWGLIFIVLAFWVVWMKFLARK